jgi:hypothetical protein
MTNPMMIGMKSIVSSKLKISCGRALQDDHPSDPGDEADDEADTDDESRDATESPFVLDGKRVAGPRRAGHLANWPVPDPGEPRLPPAAEPALPPNADQLPAVPTPVPQSRKPKRGGKALKIGGGIVAGLVALTVCERVDQGAV